MKKNEPELIAQYESPDVSRGDWLFCEMRGKVQVGGYTEAPIPWPRVLKGGKAVLILCDDLAEAVRTESVMAISYWWGVSTDVVRKWRRTLGVGRVTPGSRKLHQKLLGKRISDEAKQRGLKTMHGAEARAKASATKRGKDVHPNSMKALDQARSMPKNDSWKEQARENMRKQWAEGKRRHPQAWTENELAMLGTDTDANVADAIGRTLAAVAVKRRQYSIKPYKP